MYNTKIIDSRFKYKKITLNYICRLILFFDMKKKSLLLGLGILGMLLLNNNTSFAQDSEISGLFQSSPEDATKLIDAYATPLFKSLGTGLSNGWYNSAKAKKLFRFEVRIAATGAIVPSSDQTYDITKIGLSSNIGPSNPLNTIAPTVAGNKDNSTPSMNIYRAGVPVGSFSLPKGTGHRFIPSPQLQATVGLPKGIDVTLRLIPTIKLGDYGSVNMFGIGTRVQLDKFLAKSMLSKLPFNLAVAVGYTKLNYNLNLDVQAQGSNYTDQKLEGRFTAFNFQGLISKKILFLTPFVGLGFQTSHTKLDAKGTYPIDTGLGQTQTFTDPININKANFSGLRADIGLQMDFFLLHLYGSYSMGHYNSANIGIGIGI